MAGKSWQQLGFLFVFIAFITACKTTKVQESPKEKGTLVFHHQYVLPNHTKFEGIDIGGLSGIDYNADKQEYYMICDDRSDLAPARFYTGRVHINGYKIDSVSFIKSTTFKLPNGDTYPKRAVNPALTPDPEALRFDPTRRVFLWTSEGERTLEQPYAAITDPSITAVDSSGNTQYNLPIPAQFEMSKEEKGPRRNGVFEGLAFTPDYKYCFVSCEEPLYGDSERADTIDQKIYTRIIKYDLSTKMPIAQYLYPLSSVASIPNPKNGFRVNGVSDIMAINENQIMVIERSFSTGVKNNTIRVNLLDVSKATDVSNIMELKKATVGIDYKEPKVKALFTFDKIAGKVNMIDNVEGVTFGPVLPNGNRSLVFIVDNNFSDTEETQFYLFEWKP
ncbi:hypothetical protein LX64_00669 [Chitinophaga skermanii]|uniref:Phytase-like domain-containing protein n=1 Tax=Chitinophaga skermanii TaxID=331697 RepID=A0A327R528_9BACT|nr:esterase-like activity of phytase family protein [Chitinophaga skermanii]RAJ11062.1 hypothetical protein LX64_00669 [Chitinophaga skermanii]